jgi:GcrA cell cycle regulator
MRSQGDARGLSPWTPERQARALRLYLQEDFTAADVADALGPGFSRAAVVAKVRRLGFLKRDVRAGGDETPSQRRRAASPARDRIKGRLPPQPPPQPLPPLREVGPLGAPRPLACLPDRACRWPIDDPGPGRMHETLFCAGPAPVGVYCAAHQALAHDRAPAAAPGAVPPPMARAA